MSTHATPSPDLRHVIVQFDLPYVLRLMDSIRRETVPDGYEHYVFALDNIPAMLRFEKKLRDLGGVQIATEDRRGLLNYSTVQVWFDKQFFQRFPFTHNYRERYTELIAASLTFVNRFLDIYRDVTGSFWIRPIKHGDLANIQFVGLHEDGSQDPFRLGTLGTGLGLGSLILDEQDQLIRERLASGYLPDEIQRLAYVVMDLFDSEDYWSAALAVEILFEAKFARILRLGFENSGLSDADIDRKFEFESGHPRSITNLLTTYLRELTDVSVHDQNHPISQAYNDWCTKARDLRNDIAHGKSLSVTRTQAAEAITAVKALLGEIEKLLPDRHSTSIGSEAVQSPPRVGSSTPPA